MIRRFFLDPLATALRHRTRDRAAQAPVEYALFVLGWMVWPLDALIRIGRIAREGMAGPPPLRIGVRAVPLVSSPLRSDAALARARLVLGQAAGLLQPLGLRLEVEGIEPLWLPDGVPPPACGPAALTGGFFPWASARPGDSRKPRLTVYFVEDLGPCAGCAVPGADWLVADLRTDGTTIVHELGHLSDLWRHHADPANVMTDRPGGTHDGITPMQAAFLRSSRFAERISREGSPRPAGS